MIFLISILSLRWWYVDLKATSSEQWNGVLFKIWFLNSFFKITCLGRGQKMFVFAIVLASPYATSVIVIQIDLSLWNSDQRMKNVVHSWVHLGRLSALLWQWINVLPFIVLNKGSTVIFFPSRAIFCITNLDYCLLQMTSPPSELLWISEGFCTSFLL
jgi:hypothetical protein